jgi:predicted metal-dependent HD superfamily phosphohydrolase
MDLAARWRTFTGSIGARGDVAEVFADLDRRHRAPGRFYHTWRHVAECLAALDGQVGLCNRPAAVELALWFHDAVYDPRATDNEAQSAELLKTAAARLGADPTVASAAAGLVLATAHFGPQDRLPAGPDAALVRDIDLAILGSSPGRFAAYEAAVRREYGFLPDAAWRSGRAEVLMKFLGLSRIYATPVFHDRLERRARRNLAASLRRLGRLTVRR